MQLTKYLAEYHYVGIPEVGGFELVRQPARLDVAEKLISPPVFSVQYKNNDVVPDHQIEFIVHNDYQPSSEEELEVLGRELKRKIHSQPFLWKGIGELKTEGDQYISFQSSKLVIEGLQPIIANRVLRENVQHTILVGEREVQRKAIQENEAVIKAPRNYTEMIGWVLLLLAIAFIVYYLYSQGFQSTATGTNVKATCLM